MKAKLHPRVSVGTADVWLEPEGGSHIFYAKLNFNSKDAEGASRQLVSWLYSVGLPRSKWSQKRTLQYLRAHQPQFRSCLEWLANGAPVNLEDPDDDYGQHAEELSPEDLPLKEWAEHPDVQFLEKHGLMHGKLGLRPGGGSLLATREVDVFKARPRDPLDPLCWHLLSLGHKGLSDVRRCRYEKCSKFFTAKTERKAYCSDLCRARDHVKSPEDMRLYMREYRRNRKRLSKHSRARGGRHSQRTRIRKK